MTLIAAFDTSPVSLGAARSAARLAAKLNEPLLLVHVLQPPSIFYPELSLAGVPDLDLYTRKAASEALENVRVSLSELCAVETRLLSGDVAETLSRCAREEGARMIIMGTHGRGAVGRLLAGSVAQRTVLEAPCSVMVLPHASSPFDAWAAGQRPLRVVVGIDRTAASEAALDWIGDLRSKGPVDVTLVHRYWPPAEYARLGMRGPRDIGATDPDVVAVLQRELRVQLRDLRGQGRVNLQIEADWSRVADSLVQEADAHDADLLVVGTHQPHGWNRLKTGSSALNALHVTHRPLVCVPAHSHQRDLPVSAAEIPVIRSVLAPTDLSEPGNAAVVHAYSLLRTGGTVQLCHVREHGLSTPTYIVDDKAGALSPQERAELELQLRAIVPPRAAASGIATEILVVDGGSAADEILHASQRLGVDAVVLSSHGRSGIARALRGSVAESVLRQSKVPVYVVRASGQASG